MTVSDEASKRDAKALWAAISAWNYLNSRAELVRTNPYRSGT